MLIPSFSFGLSLLFLIYSTSVVQALPVPALTSLLRRGGSEVCRGTKLRTGKHRETCSANNADAKSYRWNGDDLETLEILSVTPQDECDHTFEIQLFHRLFDAGAAQAGRTHNQLCAQLFPPDGPMSQRRTKLPAAMESDTNLFFMPGEVNRAKAIVVSDQRDFLSSDAEVLRNRRAAAKVLKDHKADMLATVGRIFKVLAETKAEAAKGSSLKNPFTAEFATNWSTQWALEIQNLINVNEKLREASDVPPRADAACPRGTKRKRKSTITYISEDRGPNGRLRPNREYKSLKARAEKEEEDSCVPDDAAATQDGASSGLSSSRTATVSVTSTGLASSVTGSRPSSLSRSGDALLPKPTAQATASGTYRNGAATRSGEQLGSKAQTQPLAVHSIAASSPTSRLSAQSAAGQPLASAQSSKPSAVQAAPALAGKPTRIAAAPAHITPAAAAPLSRPNTPSTAKRPPLARPLRALPFGKAKPAA